MQSKHVSNFDPTASSNHVKEQGVEDFRCIGCGCTDMMFEHGDRVTVRCSNCSIEMIRYEPSDTQHVETALNAPQPQQVRTLNAGAIVVLAIAILFAAFSLFAIVLL